jgi:serine protease Do
MAKKFALASPFAPSPATKKSLEHSPLMAVSSSVVAAPTWRPLLVLLCASSIALSAAADDAANDRLVAARLLSAYTFVASGSGVVVDPSGLVVTNNHVIAMEDRQHLSIRFATGRSHPAELLGTDPVGDIAVLRILRETATGTEPDPGPFPSVPLAPADAIRPGIEVFAVGNPFGLGDLDSTPTLTRGILSTGRIVREDYTDAIQVDAPVNPGNSGGPSFDVEGRLLGINGQIRTTTGMRINSGVGLAIASPQLAAFIPRLADAKGGYVHHTKQPADLELERDASGVVVTAIGEGSLLHVGDHLLTIHGRAVVSPATATGLFASLPWEPAITAKVTLQRGDDELTINFPLDRTTIPGAVWHGLTVRQVDNGLRVEKVDRNSGAEVAGIKVNDLLLASGDLKLERRVHLLKALMKLEIGDYLPLTLRDANGNERTVSVMLRAAE